MRRYVSLLAPLAVAIGAVVLVLVGASSARSRINASTGTESLFEAGHIDLSVDSGSDPTIEQLLFDQDGLYAEQVLTRCLVVSYDGSYDQASIRLHAVRTAGTGLDDYLDVTIERGFGREFDCDDFIAESVLYSGGLDRLLDRHTNFDSGIRVSDAADAGERTTLRVRLEVADDNEAQDRTVQFLMSFEVRP